MNSKLPAYPLITLDPLFSLWSMNQTLTKSSTKHWTGQDRKIDGFITIDGQKYRFLGKKDRTEKVLKQQSLSITPLFTTYLFQNQQIELTVKFWSAFLMEDIDIMSSPVGFIDFCVHPKDSTTHQIQIDIIVDQALCYEKSGEVEGAVIKIGKMNAIKLGKKKQTPLAYSGDRVFIDWGYLYLCGMGETKNILNEGKIGYSVKGLVAQEPSHEYSHGDLHGDTHENAQGESLRLSQNSIQGPSRKEFFDSLVFAYDDIYSIEYFGEKIKGYWTERFKNIENLITYFIENRQVLHDRCISFESKLLQDAAGYSEDYKKLLIASYRQVVAAHKIIKDKEGNILLLSKECNSNGCINTVDVSYPSVPLYALYNPKLIKGLMEGIYRFAQYPCWTYEFAPHDLGQYPLANGQVYSLGDFDPKKGYVFQSPGNCFRDRGQMPNEECANMLILNYLYAVLTKDAVFESKYLPTSKKWADFLVKKGIILANQNCTDDFAGHIDQNVNLAIKSIMGIYAFGKILELVGQSGEEYLQIAQKYANQLEKLAFDGQKMPLSLLKKRSWSMKYNMVWDVVFSSHLFDPAIIEAELKWYKKKMWPFGLPLDSRSKYTKSDWEIWTSTLDPSHHMIDEVSKRIVRFLETSPTKYPFGDWYFTTLPIAIAFRHRTVQGGLWMPILRDKFSKIV